MKSLLAIAILLTPLAASADFVHPLDFDGSEAQKQEVLGYIEDRVKADYCDGQLDMCQPSNLRMMEKQNLRAFKMLTQAKDRAILDKVIEDYCEGGLDMCTYDTINMMYNQNVKANQEKLAW
ncbi:hypothetical protein [Erwinia sp. Leaf53]|uniref:hypothetical protein n=1 Tax=Erwinia sp. Leaf53 TaxID=1736225 RepID=UPI0006F4F55B|nr:hypothetical protein [Erwinia sp. Leaf53]KQN58011.1 hypothetical protein ASF13_04245 [Erwinia sp. Leaf53]